MIRLLARATALVVAAGLLLLMQRTTPGYSEITGPIPISGTIGETVTTRSFSVRAHRLFLAERLVWRRFDRVVERDTSGLWAVVVTDIEALGASVAVGGAMWRGPDGLRFEANRRVSGAPRLLSGDRLEPGLPRRGVIVFEIPRGQERGATVQLSLTRWPRLDSRADLAMPADPGEVAAVIDLDALVDG